MKSIYDFEPVKKALEQVVAESDVNNGTRGIEILCHYWTYEYQFNEERQSLQNKMGDLALAGKPEELIKTRKELEALPKPKVVMEFRLMIPIPLIRGTKTISDGNKIFTISANDVKSIFFPEDALRSELATFEETGDTAKDLLGQDTPVVRLVINKGVLDVAPEILDPRDSRRPLEQRRILRGKRVYLTAVSYHALQVVGRIQAKEQYNRFKRYGFNEQE